MKRAIREHRRDFVAILSLVTVAVAVGWYILDNQRLRFPIIEPKPYRLNAEMVTAQAVTPGQGQTVRVAGIRIGDIAGTKLKDGRAIVELDIDQKYKDLIRTDAFALLRPKTGLKDMFLEVTPGKDSSPAAKEGFTLPVSNTLPDVNPDEFLAQLDTDTRDYLKLLLKGARQGLDGRSDDLREVLKRFEPTYRDLALVTEKVAERRTELRRLVTSLNRLNSHLATKDDDLAQLVDASSRVFRALASEKGNVAATVQELPSALRQAETTLGKVDQTARILGPTVERLRPAIRQLRETNAATRPLAEEAAPLLQRDIRPFVREARPLVRELRPAVGDLAEAEPGLTRSFRVLNRFFNMLAHNKDGAEPPEKRDRDEGYLFYLGWLGHQVNNLFRNQDAHGPGRPITTGGTCATIQQTVGAQPELEALLGLTGALTDPLVCGQTAEARSAAKGEKD